MSDYEITFDDLINPEDRVGVLHPEFCLQKPGPPPFVVLLGEDGGTWRQPLIKHLEEYSIHWLDSTNVGWPVVSAKDSETRQVDVTRAVSRYHNAMDSAACVVLYSSAANPMRYQFGYCTGRQVRTFFYVSPDDNQRTLFYALAVLHNNMIRCNSLQDAVEQAVSYVDRLVRDY